MNELRNRMTSYRTQVNKILLRILKTREATAVQKLGVQVTASHHSKRRPEIISSIRFLTVLIYKSHDHILQGSIIITTLIQNTSEN
jgi:hypothetical protein